MQVNKSNMNKKPVNVVMNKVINVVPGDNKIVDDDKIAELKKKRELYNQKQRENYAVKSAAKSAVNPVIIYNSQKCCSKCCSKCGETKDIIEFSKNRADCQICNRQACKDYKARNRNKISGYNKEYKSEHKEEVRTYNREWSAKRKITHPEYKIKCNLRIRMNKVLNGKEKAGKTLDLLGCTLSFLVEWFKYRFIGNMSMENHDSVWHVDHVMPCASFNLTKPEEQKKCFHWTNLQPMYGSDNVIKNDKIDPVEIENQQKYIKLFIKMQKEKGIELTLDHPNNYLETTITETTCIYDNYENTPEELDKLLNYDIIDLSRVYDNIINFKEL